MLKLSLECMRDVSQLAHSNLGLRLRVTACPSFFFASQVTTDSRRANCHSLCAWSHLHACIIAYDNDDDCISRRDGLPLLLFHHSQFPKAYLHPATSTTCQ